MPLQLLWNFIEKKKSACSVHSYRGDSIGAKPAGWDLGTKQYMQGNCSARPSLRVGFTDRGTSHYLCLKNAEPIHRWGLCPLLFIWVASLFLMPDIWCDKGASMTAWAPRHFRNDRMGASRHASGVARWHKLVGFLIWPLAKAVSSRTVQICPCIFPFRDRL